MTRLPPAEWQDDPRLAALVDALSADGGAVRYVGGAVRDTIAGLPVTDIDLATPLLPQEVARRLRDAGIKAVPTGIAHGTITAVVDGRPFEVTTLRRDVATDGRRATVRFSTDWREDAARRDFTINALYADPATRRVTDFFGGLADLAEGRVRFIGDADRRIDEDHLRILRFFRFHARFGQGAPDAEALAAVTAKATTMRSLSQERLAGELLRLLALPDPRGTVLLMIERGIFAAIIPEFDTASHDRLARLIASERACDLAIDPVRRLIAMAPVDAAKAVALATRLKVSTAIRRRFRCARTEPLDRTADPRHLAYAIGIEGARDRWLLAADPDDAARALDRLEGWTPPQFPIKGGMLVAQGVPVGPEVARLLREIEEQWVADDFPDATRARAIMAQRLSERSQ
ncbi:MAG: CCA tRNA nucleotidyltransferase [Sphingomonadales bacterium]|nr:CCA tRNA nucleotidyltransferase [Sphingomonadales bacterium]